MKRSVRLAFLIASAALALSCAKTAPPITSPSLPSEPAAPAWLTVQDDRKFVAYTEFSGELPPGTLKEDPFPGPADVKMNVKEFSHEFLAKTSVSADGVTVVRALGESFTDPFRRVLNALLLEKDYPELTMREFRKALRRGQLTCHAGLETGYIEGGTWVRTGYSCVTSVKCINNLLFSLVPPMDPEKLTASLALFREGESDTRACVPEFASGGGAEPSGPWLVEWRDLLPVLQGVTSLEETDTKIMGVCLRNISPEEAGGDMGLADAASAALIQFAHAIGGEEGIMVLLDLVAGRGATPPLWEDPCLPQKLAPMLFRERIGILIPEDLLGACANSRAARETASGAGGAD